MARLIRTNGTIESLDVPASGLTLEQLQRYVGGYIEFVHLGQHETGGQSVLVVNEDGKRAGLPVNDAATMIARGALRGVDVIVGDAVLAVVSHAGEDDERIA